MDELELQTYIEDVRKKYNLPALAVGVSRAGQPDIMVACGVRKIGDDTPVTNDDMFYVSSCGKAVTAALIRKLIDEGVLNIHETLADFFPDLSVHEEYKDVTIKDLLTHTAGLPRDVGFITLAPMYSKGAYHYSNVGYAILGEIAERATGKPFSQLVQDEIFDPLDMKTTQFSKPDQGDLDYPDQPYGHIKQPSYTQEQLDQYKCGEIERLPESVLKDVKPDFPEELYPAGFMMRTSPADWLKFLKFELSQPMTKYAEAWVGVAGQVSYLDTALFREADDTFSHNGTSSGSCATHRIMPKEGAAFCVFATADNWEAINEIQDYLIGQIRRSVRKDFTSWGSVRGASPMRQGR